jgi:SAM-dependent methyltransferase
LKNAAPPSGVHNMHALDVDCGSLYDPNLLVEGCLAVGAPLSSGMRCLDFGCSSGRVVRTMKAVYPEVSWVACDPESDAVTWAASQFPGIEFFTSPRVPPLRVEERSFDLVYAISIWSHFREDMALAWLDEMARIVKPGGHCWFTTHGMTSLAHWKRDAAPQRLVELERIARTLAMEGFHFEDAYSEVGDWGADTSSWGMAYFTPTWLARHLLPNWKLAYYRPGYLAWNQDTYILQRR